VRTQFMVRCSDDSARLVRVCCSDRVADYAVRYLQPGDRIRATGTMNERTWTTASGEQASSFRLLAEDLTALREDDQ
jgi:single-stranded DNA-binding protein